ncbi:MAG: D-alanine--D-alanine ligase, partial [Candidatus Micrarchaeia archaeon]
MKVVILYNFMSELSRGQDADIIADQDILNTVRAVEQVLKKDGHETVPLQADQNLYENLLLLKPDVVFNLAEGFGSNVLAEAYIPAMLDMMGIPYTGSNSLTLSVCLN